MGKKIQTASYNGRCTEGLYFANILGQVLSKLSAFGFLDTRSYCATIFVDQIRSEDTMHLELNVAI